MKRKRDNPIAVDGRELLRSQEAADFLGFSLTILKQMQRERLMPRPMKCNAAYYFRRRELIDWISAGCPPGSQWSWVPSELLPVCEQVRLKRIELSNLEREIAQKSNN